MSSFQEAKNAWASVLAEPVIETPTLANCITVNKPVSAILYPKTQAEIIACVKIAHQYHVPLYPVSTGNNWGYGTSLPVQDDCAILHLSKMNQILDFDPDTGLITLEPGVTQRQLAQFLDEQQYPYLIPVTGAGPDCSIVGNAIERGYGITPYADHFASVISLEAILPDGSVYHPTLSLLGDKNIDTLHKWGMI